MSKSFDHLKKLSEWVVDDRVRLSVIGAGFGAFLDLSPPKHDHALLSALVDHYDVSERCFVFNDVKLHFGLEDVWHITGLPVDGEVVTGVEGNSIQLSIEYLGENLCEDKRGAIKLSTLKNRFQNVPAEIDSRELTYYIRAYLLYVLGTVILPDKSGSMVPTIYLPLLEDIKKVHHYAWGAALLAHLHVALANCKKQGSQSIMGHTFSLLVFVLLRICKILRLSLRLGDGDGDGEREDLVSSINFPIAVGWSKVLSDHSRNNFNKATREDYSRILNGLQDDDITWQPYIGLQGLPVDGSRQQTVARSRTILICYEKAVYHRPDVAPKQFGYKSVVVADKMIDVKVRGRSGPKPKNQKGIDWGEKYSEYVSVWKRRTSPGCLIIEEEVGVLENAGGEASASVEATFSRGGDACQTDEQEEVGVLENAGGEASASVEATFSRGGDACQTDEQEEVVVLENAGWETSVEAMFSQGGDACHGGDDTFSQGGDACQTDEQDHTVDIQAETLRKISSSYDRDKKFWAMAVSNLEEKIKVMKEQHFQLSSEAHKCANSIPDWTIMISAIQSLVSHCEDLKVKFNEEHQERRKLYNQVQEAKGNIRVFCRCRPLSKTEVAAGHATVVDFDAAKDGELGILTGGSTKKFSFDRVYTPKDDQVDVFADASPMVISVLDGYNVCIFAYGQTGTGKTYTVEGTQHNRGINYRTLEELFKVSKCRSATFTFEISVSVLEVYNEQIRDLLATSPPSKKLEIKVDSEGFHHVPGVVEVKVEDTDEVWGVLQTGSSARAVGSNNVNEHSSRSHCMLCTMVKAKNLLSGACTKSRLWLVDLAGSERFAKTGFQSPNRRREAQNINKSLTHLGDVISALASKNTHIPYRNSKLTHLLQDSLGGHSKTLMFVQISPSEQDLKETLCSLNFATRVQGVELGPAKKQIDTSELRNLKTKVEELESKLKEKQHNSEPALHQKVEELERELKEKCDTESLLHQKVEELERKLKQKQDNSEQKIKELEDKLREISFQSEV